MKISGILYDESGTALLEYTVLVGVILAGAISVMLLVGPWIEREWTGLEQGMACTLPEAAEPCVPPGHAK